MKNTLRRINAFPDPVSAQHHSSLFNPSPAHQPMPLQLTPSSSSQHDLIKNGWFAETEAMWPGQKFCIEVDEVLANGRSEFQVSQASPAADCLWSD